MKPVIKFTLKIFLIFNICLFGLTTYVNAQQKTNRPAKEPYASLSPSDKLEVQKKLIANLRVDSDFIAMEKLRADIVKDLNNTKNAKVKKVDKVADSLKAAKRREDAFQMLGTTMILMKRYPQLRQLDTEAFKSVINQAKIGN